MNKDWFTFLLIMVLWVLGSSEVKAADVYVGTNWTHVSQVNVGPPFNDKMESSVDHLGIHAEIRWTSGPEWTAGISTGKNMNITGSSIPWNDGSGIGSTLYIKASWKIGEF